MHQIDFEYDEYENCYVLKCPDCSWRKHYYSTKNRLDTISKGEPGVHKFDIGGLEISPPKVKQKDYLAPFKEFLK